jgi:hypothetical protein
VLCHLETRNVALRDDAGIRWSLSVVPIAGVMATGIREIAGSDFGLDGRSWKALINRATQERDRVSEGLSR